MAGPTALDLDFQRQPGERARRVNRGLLVAGALLLALAGAEYASVESERAALQASLDQSRARARGASVPATGGDARETDAAARAASTVVAELGAPWGQLFAALDTAASGDVALLALQADPSSDTVRLSGEGRTFGAVTSYVRGLDATPGVRDVTLLAHEVRQHDPQRPVAFTLSAKWERRP